MKVVLLLSLFLGSFCAAQEQYQQQIEFWANRLETQPRTYLGRENLASALVKQARVTGDETLYTKAEKHLVDAVELAPQTRWITKAKLASVLMKRHGFIEARKILKKLNEDFGDQPLIIRLLGDAEYGIGNKSEAKRLFTQYAEQAPGFSALVRLGGKKNLQKALKASSQLDIETKAWIRLRLGIEALNANDLVEG